MAIFSPQRGRFPQLSEEKLEEELNKVNPDVKENKIVLLTVLNPVYWLSLDTIKKVCGEAGQLEKIVMFERGSVIHALVQYRDLEAALEAKATLHGCNIFRDSCTIKVEFAKQEDLNVRTNDARTWDFTSGKNNSSKLNGHGKVTRRVLITEEPVEPNGRMSSERWFNEENVNQPQSNGRIGGGGGYQDMEKSPVIMVYNLDMERFNCQKVFNLLCLYGNVDKINFIRSKDGCAMVEFANAIAASDAVRLLNNILVFGARLNMEVSRKMYVEEIRNPYDLPRGDKSFENFIGDKNNRFNTPQQAAKNRMVPPSNLLHFYNVPKMEDDAMMDIFTEANAPFPVKITWFETKSGKAATGLVEFETVEEACEAVVIVNNIEIEADNAARPFIMKLCFSRN